MNPATQAASIVKASPGTMVFAVVGLSFALLGVEAAKFGAGKIKSGLMSARNAVAPPAQTGASAGSSGGWS